MSDQRLLERLSRPAPGGGLRRGGDPSVRLPSIVRHLRRLLNTRQGSAGIAEDYGLPDLTAMISGSGSFPAREIEENLARVVERYEPRLHRVKVTLVPDTDGILVRRFRLEAYLAEDWNLPVVFETVISADGRVDLHEA
ncbi:MAG: type VI secretion system baseplate subunit TssE [Candidatus Zixiibacteriota bacterium]|nr:MAG: type VI secretion system baseplate subunit TssE [candidate division Zixibacteria bacterium]